MAKRLIDSITFSQRAEGQAEYNNVPVTDKLNEWHRHLDGEIISIETLPYSQTMGTGIRVWYFKGHPNA